MGVQRMEAADWPTSQQYFAASLAALRQEPTSTPQKFSFAAQYYTAVQLLAAAANAYHQKAAQLYRCVVRPGTGAICCLGRGLGIAMPPCGLQAACAVPKLCNPVTFQQHFNISTKFSSSSFATTFADKPGNLTPLSPGLPPTSTPMTSTRCRSSRRRCAGTRPWATSSMPQTN